MKHTLDELKRIDDATLAILFNDIEELRRTGVSEHTLLREWISHFYLHDGDEDKFYANPITFLCNEICREGARRFVEGVHI